MESYGSIFELAKQANYKKIMICRDSWRSGSWATVNRIERKGQYGKAWGHIHYLDGTNKHGELPCAGCSSWKTIKLLDNQEMDVADVS